MYSVVSDSYIFTLSVVRVRIFFSSITFLYNNVDVRVLCNIFYGISCGWYWIEMGSTLMFYFFLFLFYLGIIQFEDRVSNF